MAYFTKEAYEAKANYAYKISGNGIRKIAETLAMRKIYNLDDNKLEPTPEELDNEDLYDSLQDLICELEEELEPVSQLSHARHEMHSSKWDDFDCFDKIGHDCSYEETLVGIVNDLNEKYSLSNVTLINAMLPPCFGGDKELDVICCDELCIDYNENGDNTIMYEMVEEKWNDEKEKMSTMIRSFFKSVNEKFGTDFPD